MRKLRLGEGMSPGIGDSTGRSNREVFGELYEEYMPKIYRYVSYRVNDVATAEDITSIVFEKALTRFQDYCSERGAISTWLFTIARNSVIDYYRRRSKRPTVPLDDALPLANGGDPVAAEMERREMLDLLRLCLEILSHREQDIVSLKFGGEATNRQISHLVRLSESNIGTILYRAVRKLRDCFQERSDVKRK
jgi:RNA polymerase sigma factor (sigma-70 family)